MSPSTLKPETKFLLDENVNIKVAAFLKEKGFDVHIVPKGITNGDVIKLAKRERRILITHDTDFGQPTLYSSTQIYSIIIFRIHPPLLEKLTVALEKFLAKDESIEGNRFLLDEEGYTIIE